MGTGVWMRCWLLVSGTGLGWQQGGDTQPGGLQRVRGDRDVAADSQPERLSPLELVLSHPAVHGGFLWLREEPEHICLRRRDPTALLRPVCSRWSIQPQHAKAY